MVADVLQMHKGMVVEEVPVSSIRTKFRLRTPDEEKIREIATSISFCGLINPVSITSDGWLLAGYHRWKAFELLVMPPFLRLSMMKMNYEENW